MSGSMLDEKNQIYGDAEMAVMIGQLCDAER